MRNSCRKANAIFPHAKNARGFVAALRFALVFYVMLFKYIAQIAKTIVRFIAVDMINLTYGPRAGHVQPRKAMAFVRLAINCRSQIAFIGQTARYAALFNARLFESARKRPRKRIVVENFFKAVLRKHGGSLTQTERA